MERLFDAIPAVLKGLDANPETDRAVVFAAWKNCVGEILQKRTAPLHFAKNRLIVAVRDETWQRHLEALSPQMLVKINDRLGHGTVRFIEFRVDASIL
jgi:hypothetical protein